MDFVIDILLGFWATLGEMAPYLLLGFLVAGMLSVLIPPRVVEKHLGGRSVLSVLKASAFGVPLPLCSCGVIPVGTTLYRHGAGRGATTAFLISTPQTGVDSILVTFSLLGPVFAIFKPVAALISGMVGGILAGAVGGRDVRLPGDDKLPPAAPAAEPNPGDTCTAGCCSSEPGGKFLHAMRYGFGDLPRDIGRALLIGLALAALITAVVGPGALSDYMGLNRTAGWSGLAVMALMVLVGVPVYVCATASVPVAAALIAGGVSPGAALVFLMTGPATNAATIATIWKVMGRRTALVYLLTVIVSAVASGMILDTWWRSAGLGPVEHVHQLLPGWFKQVAAVVLLAVLARAILWPRIAERLGRSDATSGDLPADMREYRLDVSGMTCGHCAGAVRQALLETPGVETAEVSLKEDLAVVTGRDLDAEDLAEQVRQAGYEARPARPLGS